MRAKGSEVAEAHALAVAGVAKTLGIVNAKAAAADELRRSLEYAQMEAENLLADGVWQRILLRVHLLSLAHN